MASLSRDREEDRRDGEKQNVDDVPPGSRLVHIRGPAGAPVLRCVFSDNQAPPPPVRKQTRAMKVQHGCFESLRWALASLQQQICVVSKNSFPPVVKLQLRTFLENHCSDSIRFFSIHFRFLHPLGHNWANPDPNPVFTKAHFLLMLKPYFPSLKLFIFPFFCSLNWTISYTQHVILNVPVTIWAKSMSTAPEPR